MHSQIYKHKNNKLLYLCLMLVNELIFLFFVENGKILEPRINASKSIFDDIIFLKNK